MTIAIFKPPEDEGPPGDSLVGGIIVENDGGERTAPEEEAEEQEEQEEAWRVQNRARWFRPDELVLGGRVSVLDLMSCNLTSSEMKKEMGDVQVVLLEGSGPWRIPGVCSVETVADKWYRFSDDQNEIEEQTDFLKEYGLCKKSENRDKILDDALVKLYRLIDKKNQNQEQKQAEEQDYQNTWKNVIGSSMISLSELEMPKLFLAILRFLSMTTNPSSPSSTKMGTSKGTIKGTKEQDTYKLKSISAIFKLLSIRGKQLCSLTNHSKWSLRLDLIIGMFLGILLGLNSETFGDAMYDSIGYGLQSDVMEQRVRWILSQHAPLGFKLNHGLDQVLGETTILTVQFWHHVTSKIAPCAPVLLMIAGFFAAIGGGFSLMVAIGCDVIRFVTLHVQFLFNFFSRLHRFQLLGMSTCWKIIRGKKYNVLRRRVDTGDYDTGQLLLGSVAFIVFAFLFQTTFAYYAMFALIWMAIVFCHGILFVTMHMVRSFPLADLLQPSTSFPCDLRMNTLGSRSYGTVSLQSIYLSRFTLLKHWFSLILTHWHLSFESWEYSLISALCFGHPITLASNA